MGLESARGVSSKERRRIQPKDAWQPIISRGELQERAAWGVQRGWGGVGGRASTSSAGDQSRCGRVGASPPQQLLQ